MATAGAQCKSLSLFQLCRNKSPRTTPGRGQAPPYMCQFSTIIPHAKTSKLCYNNRNTLIEKSHLWTGETVISRLFLSCGQRFARNSRWQAERRNLEVSFLEKSSLIVV